MIKQQTAAHAEGSRLPGVDPDELKIGKPKNMVNAANVARSNERFRRCVSLRGQ